MLLSNVVLFNIWFCILGTHSYCGFFVLCITNYGEGRLLSFPLVILFTLITSSEG